MEDEIQNYLNYIRSMGIKAWIPDSPGYGPKMSVADQCRSRILCLDYDGSEIYIQCTDNHVTTCDGKRSCSVKNCVRVAQSVWLRDNTNRFENCGCDAGNPTRKDVVVAGAGAGGPAKYLANTFRERSKQCAADCNNGVDDGRSRGTSKNALPPRRPEVDETIETAKSSSVYGAPGRPQYKRIVHEKLTREVRVAKRYVSSLPNVQYGFDRRKTDEAAAAAAADRAENVPRRSRERRADDKNPGQVAKSGGPVRGFVRRLIERFDVDATEPN